MKELLFEILDNLEPYKTIKIGVNNNEFYICRTDSCFPLAIRFLEYEPEMERSNYFYSYDQDCNNEYVKSHKVNLYDRDYLIETEIINMQYYDNYFCVTYNCVGGKSDYFIPYESISFISHNNLNTISAGSTLTIEYNKIQYELNKWGA